MGTISESERRRIEAEERIREEIRKETTRKRTIFYAGILGILVLLYLLISYLRHGEIIIF